MDAWWPVIDALAPGIELRSLGELLADPAVVKVFHAARQDVEIFLELFGQVPVPIFDTQVAAMVAGFGDQVGYDSLVSSLTGGQIDKAHRFSDWAARPLSASQVAYAAADVTYLRLVYTSLCDRLQRDGRLEWVREEMGVLAEPSTYRGRCGVDQRSATSRAIRAPASDSSRMRCSMPYSPRLPRFAPNVLVSTQSAPAARYASCTPATTSGRVTLSTSLQPSCPSKSSRARSAACSMVPIAPSATRTRSARASNSESGTVLRLSDAARRRLRG